MQLKFFLAPFAFVLFLSACSDSPGISGNTADSNHYECILPPPDSFAPPVVNQDTITECFRFDHGDQHRWMSLTRIADSARGDLHYTWEGKDGSHGPFTGYFRGDSLWIIYEATIEGHVIKREMCFLRNGDQLLEGQGTQESNEAGDYYYFKHRRMIVFEKTGAMVKGPCM